MFLLRSKKRRLILNVSDLWPSAGFELGALKKNFSYNLLKKLEIFNYKNADLVLGQSNEILSHIKQIIPQQELFLYRNYPDIKQSVIIEKNSKNKKIRIVYAGLLGVAQGILRLCKNLEYSKIEFHIYGSGAEESQIKSFIDDRKDLPIFFHGRVNRSQLHQELLNYDVAVIPLLNRIYGSVPSKIFEFAKLGLPILYFGGGEGEKIIAEHQLGWVAEAGNYNSLNETINAIDLIDIGFEKRKAISNIAHQVFDFKKQLSQLAEML